MGLLEIIDRVDTHPYTTNTTYYTLKAHTGTPIGLVAPEYVPYLEKLEVFVVNKGTITIKTVDTVEARDAAIAQAAESLRNERYFEQAVKKGWRGELYTVYEPQGVPYFHVERAVSVLLGVITYGIHLTGYVPSDKSLDGRLKMWVPRRSATKQTYPNMLDNTVAGGLGYPYGPDETVVKESYEEAGLPEDFVTARAKATGVVLYMYVSGKNVQPEVEYTYDLAFDDETSVVPVPVDGEAQLFELMPVDEVLERVQKGEFKPNCGLVIVDFLIRHGAVTPTSEPDYLEILSRMHRRMPFPTR